MIVRQTLDLSFLAPHLRPSYVDFSEPCDVANLTVMHDILASCSGVYAETLS